MLDDHKNNVALVKPWHPDPGRDNLSKKKPNLRQKNRTYAKKTELSKKTSVFNQMFICD